MLLTVLLAVVVGVGTWANVAGVRTRLEHLVERVDLALHPPADRDTVGTIEVTPPPGEVDDDDIAVVPDPTNEVELLAEPDEPSPTPTRPLVVPTERPVGSTADPTDAATPTPTATARPERKPVRFKLKVADPETKFISQVDNTMCAAAGLQMVLGMHDQVPMTQAFQRRLDGRLDEWESRQDAKAGGWGPSSMAEALAAYGVAGYEVRAYENRNQSLREAAAAMVRTGAPAILIAWRGAHTWVMTGFRADADPTVFEDARITGINVFDPWYPTVSTIWGPSDPPGTLQDLAEIKRNFLQWERPEGRYPDRDGKYIVVLPTIPLKEQRGDVR
ncbi:MAG: papain-like cysteine protease family protein [Chloroflexota bacterium]